MNCKVSLLGICLGLVLVSSSMAAGNTEQGRKKAQACVVCHGPLGIASSPGVPHLAGQPAVYLMEQLKNYRSGKRQNPVMAVMAKPLSDEDIQDIALWYSSQEIQIKP